MDEKAIPYACWHMTLRCNMRPRCSWCYAPKSGHEPTKSRMLVVGNSLAECCERVSFMGGEPLLNPHVPEIARRMHGRCGLSLASCC